MLASCCSAAASRVGRSFRCGIGLPLPSCDHTVRPVACGVARTARSWHEAIGGKGAKTVAVVRSDDGTAIAYERQGDGPALVVVDGAPTTRRSESKAQLVELPSPLLTGYGHDRPGRGR